MKTATFLLFFLISLPLFAQRGYCPCMERNKKNDGIDLTSVLNIIDDQSVDLNTMAADPVMARPVLVSRPPRPSDSPSVQAVQQIQTAQQVQEVAESKIPVAKEQRTSVRSADRKKRNGYKQKRKKRSRRLKLRTKKRIKKYRGNCPKFNL